MISTSAKDLRGSMSAGTVCDEGIYHLSFASTLSLNGKLLKATGTAIDGGRMAFDVPVSAGDRIEVRSGLSVVDPHSVRRVLTRALGERSLETIRQHARAAWSRELDRVRIPGSDEWGRLFYTQLFRVLQTPARIDDTDAGPRQARLHRHPACF